MLTLKDLFLDELADMYDAEHRITKALPKMIKSATDADLKQGLENHLDETIDQIERLQQVFVLFGKKPKGKECKATVGLLKEGDEIVGDNKGEPTLDAGVIAACQKVEHYEIASYGCLIAWAKKLENNKAVDLLQQSLEEEKNANTTLNSAAKTANQAAMLEENDDIAPRKSSRFLKANSR